MEEPTSGDSVDYAELPLWVVMWLVEAAVRRDFYLFKMAPLDSTALLGVFLALDFMLLINSSYAGLVVM